MLLTVVHSSEWNLHTLQCDSSVFFPIVAKDNPEVSCSFHASHQHTHTPEMKWRNVLPVTSGIQDPGFLDQGQFHFLNAITCSKSRLQTSVNIEQNQGRNEYQWRSLIYVPALPNEEKMASPHPVKIWRSVTLAMESTDSAHFFISVCGHKRSKWWHESAQSTYSWICQASADSRTIHPQSMPPNYSIAPWVDAQRHQTNGRQDLVTGAQLSHNVWSETKQTPRPCTLALLK